MKILKGKVFKIISYSIFGEELIYQRGLKANIGIAKDLFPDWTVRVYCSSLLPKDFIKSLDKENVELIKKFPIDTGGRLSSYIQEETFMNDNYYRSYISNLPNPPLKESLLKTHLKIASLWDYKKTIL